MEYLVRRVGCSGTTASVCLFCCLFVCPVWCCQCCGACGEYNNNTGKQDGDIKTMSSRGITPIPTRIRSDPASAGPEHRLLRRPEKPMRPRSTPPSLSSVAGPRTRHRDDLLGMQHSCYAPCLPLCARHISLPRYRISITDPPLPRHIDQVQVPHVLQAT